MRIFLLLFALFISLPLFAQEEKETLDWINENSIKIEDANPDTELTIFKNNIPDSFANARVFGFGEASHHGKEFFDLKAKFFKFLVETQDVKAFIMEETYQAEAGINEWINGGEGDSETIAKNFNIVPWKCKEVVHLLEWMREFNSSRPKEDQIRFYGMDIQLGKGINVEIRDFVNKYKIPVSEELLAVADSCANNVVNYNEDADLGKNQLPKLEEIIKTIKDFQAISDESDNQEFKAIIRATNYLIKYTTYLHSPKSEVRDLKMFENVKWIVEEETTNGKAFIWAHNDHVNNLTFNYYGMSWVNLGHHLKEHYKNDYYSVGFDFGIGTLPGIVTKKNKPVKWKNYTLTTPFRKTYAETLIKADDAIYFIDMHVALTSDPTNFFSTINKQLGLGAPGYNPKKKYILTKKFSEMFDGIIFVKRISVPDYNLQND